MAAKSKRANLSDFDRFKVRTPPLSAPRVRPPASSVLANHLCGGRSLAVCVGTLGPRCLASLGAGCPFVWCLMGASRRVSYHAALTCLRRLAQVMVARKEKAKAVKAKVAELSK